HRASGLNLVVAAIILWNTVYLDRAIGALRQQGRQIDDGLLKHVAPVHWYHINLTGDYSWRQNKRVEKGGFRPLRLPPRAIADQSRDSPAEPRPAVRLEGAKAVKVQDRRLMPRHGLLRVVGQINPLQGHSDPIGDVREVASMEGRDRGCKPKPP